MKLSLVIPAYNEAENIGPTLELFRDRLKREGINYEFVVVDDDSKDTTAQVVEGYMAADPGIRLVRNFGKHGFGYAVRCGLDHFTGDAVVIVMADASDDPEDVVTYYYILRDRADCAFGSRFIDGARIVDYPRFKLFINRLANLFIQIMFGLRFNDVTNAFKGYRAYVITGCKPFFSPHFNLTVEIPLKAIVRGYSFATTPINWYNRKHGTSNLRIPEMGSRYLYTVLNLWLEKKLTRGDYQRPAGETFIPWTDSYRSHEQATPEAHEMASHGR